MEQGYNHNVEHGGVVFHVQTEDSGTPGCSLRTHLFYEGRILTSSESSYSESVKATEIQAMMQEQHKAMIAMLRAGEYDSTIQDAGLELTKHAWPMEVPAWLAKHVPPTFLKPKSKAETSEQPNETIMKATIDSCAEADYAPVTTNDETLADVIDAALTED